MIEYVGGVVTGNATITQDDSSLDVDATGGNRTVTLPEGRLGFECHVAKVDSSSNTVTLLPTGTETINGAASYALTTQWQAVRPVKTQPTDWRLF